MAAASQEVNPSSGVTVHWVCAAIRALWQAQPGHPLTLPAALAASSSYKHVGSAETLGLRPRLGF